MEREWLQMGQRFYAEVTIAVRPTSIAKEPVCTPSHMWGRESE